MVILDSQSLVPESEIVAGKAWTDLVALLFSRSEIYMEPRWK